VVHAERAGRAAALVALRQAAKDFLSGTVDAALVGGVDSLLRPDALTALRDGGALRSASHPQGILPGEGAAFLVLERVPPPSSRPLAMLEAIVTEDEPTVGTDDANTAYALTRVLRKLRLSARSFRSRPLALCDLNGDRYRAMEWAMASMRAFADLSGDALVWHPADCIGDAGAAMGAIDLVWAAVALSKGYAPGERVVVWGASDGPERAAALLTQAAKP
jgi:3-oxoacyl-[acyl-carrier-protein] synthase-1